MSTVKKFLFTILFIQTHILFSQEAVNISGFIYDKETNDPLPYVNIGFINESVGTVTDESGRFELKFDLTKIDNNSTLQISYLGYTTVEIKASEFFATIAKNNKIFLKPSPYELGEIVLTNDLRKENDIGSLQLKHGTVGYWLNPEALGGEIATKFTIDKQKTKLHELKFHIVRNNSAGIKVRVNIYEYHNGFPGKNILTENIYHVITTTSGLETINLEPYNVVVDRDIVVSLELIKVNGGVIDFELGGSDYVTNSFIRLSNQDDWDRFPQIGMAMKLRTSFPSASGKVIARNRSLPKSVTIYWDASASMATSDRDLKKELNLLEKYLKKLKSVNVKIITFSTTILDEHEFYLTTGNTDGVINYLENVDYDGESNFDQILKTNAFESQAAFLFSDGKTILAPLNQTVYIPTFSINSLADANHVALQKASSYGDGYYINLYELSLKDGLEMLFNEHYDNNSYEEDKLTAQAIEGVVISDSLLVPAASILVKNTFQRTSTDNEGRFSINAKVGDIIIVNALGMIEKEVRISEEEILKINLVPNATKLDVVELYGKKRKESEKTLTPYGMKKVDAVGYTANTLTQDDIAPGDISYDDIVRKLPGVLISGVGQNKRYSFLINTFATTGQFTDPNPIIVVDDIIYFQKDGLDHLPPLDMRNVESVKAIKSVVGTNRYGSAGAYGAIEIRTNYTSKRKDDVVEKKENTALAKGNDYSETNIPKLEDSEIPPLYISELQKASSFEDAKSIYFSQKNAERDISYFVNVSDYFTKWDKNFSTVVLSNIAFLAGNNAKALKTMAFQLEESGDFLTAKTIYERIRDLLPNDAQSYRDLANIYQKSEDYQESMEMYKRILSNSIPGVDFSGIEQSIIEELKHLLALHRSEVDYQDIPPAWLSANFKQDARIIFEWNDTFAEFDLQFVNPQKKFYKWSHSEFISPQELLDEAKNGIMMQTYIIDEEEPGEWIINLESIKNGSSNNPGFLKYTVYHNYGTAGETSSVKLINLDQLEKKVTLDRLTIN